MNRHTTMALLLTALSMTAKTSSAETPNIVLIMADDLGYGDVGCYGNPVNRTPHIDALAASGLRFTDFHSAGPMCSPTRAALLTGQYQQRFGRKFDTALSSHDHRESGLPHSAVTLAEVLKERGYATACFGKWHLGYQPPWLPTSQGFDVFRGLGSGDGDFHSHIDRSGNEDWWHNDRIEMASGYTTDLLTKYSVDFIAAHEAQPFFLYVPHLAIHFPWQGPRDPGHRVRGTNYDDDKWGIIPDPGNVAPHVKAMVESLDQSVGAIVAELQQRNLAEKTLVIFTSDNGGYLTYDPNFKNISSNGVLRGQKTDLYEGGHRVPMAIAWPGRIKPGVTAQTSHSVDLLPTIATMVGISPEDISTDGVDLVPLLLNEESLPDRTLFWRARKQSAVRRGPWKLYRNDGLTELYNLDDDLSEQFNQAEKHPELVNELHAAWITWEGDVNRNAERFEK